MEEPVPLVAVLLWCLAPLLQQWLVITAVFLPLSVLATLAWQGNQVFEKINPP